MKNFFNISDLNSNQINILLETPINTNYLSKKNIGLIFEKQSTRTRLSFNVGISQLNGNAIDIKFEELNISREESFEDTFKAMNCYLDGLVYRTSNHDNLIKASNYFEKPIINALSDLSHPCQILSDLYTIKEHFGNLNISILWMGDMNNVCYSLVEAANLLKDLNLIICSPLRISDNIHWHSGSNVLITDNISKIDLSEVRCVMTDVFISMNDTDNEEKIELLKPYKVSSDLFSKTHRESIFMHCLPAKVGFEVSQSVFSGSKSIVWRQAYNRLVVQKKLMQFMNWN